MKNVYIKSNGLSLESPLIIKKLESLGGVNKFNFMGNGEGYYFIRDSGDIWFDIDKPSDYRQLYLRK